jgi:hypothetical protein
LEEEDGYEQCRVGWTARGCLRMNKSGARKHGSESGTYRQIAIELLESKGQREPFLAFLLLKSAGRRAFGYTDSMTCVAWADASQRDGRKRLKN